MKLLTPALRAAGPAPLPIPRLRAGEVSPSRHGAARRPGRAVTRPGSRAAAGLPPTLRTARASPAAPPGPAAAEHQSSPVHHPGPADRPGPADPAGPGEKPVTTGHSGPRQARRPDPRAEIGRAHV